MSRLYLVNKFNNKLNNLIKRNNYLILLKKFYTSKLLIIFFLWMFPKKLFKTNLCYRCPFSNLSKGINNKFKVSRFVLKNKVFNLEIPGVILLR